MFSARPTGAGRADLIAENPGGFHLRAHSVSVTESTWEFPAVSWRARRRFRSVGTDRGPIERAEIARGLGDVGVSRWRVSYGVG